MTLDLKSADGREKLLALAARSDALVENFRPGQLERYGLGPAELHAANPRLVIARISGYGQDGPYRDRPAANLDAIADCLVKLAFMATDLEDLAELDINPLLADENGVVAIDTRIRVTNGATGQASQPAIRPYPASLECSLNLTNGERFSLRPIRPDDASRLTAMVEASAAEDVRLRFRAGLKRLPLAWAERLSQIDYEREMALVAEDAEGAILGVGRLAADPEGTVGEFALMVRTDHQARGLGHALLSEVLGYARGRGLKTVWGHIERGNERMLALATDLGFAIDAADDPVLLRATKALWK